MNLLIERGKNDNLPNVFAFNTFFYPKLISGGHSALKRWTKKVIKKILFTVKYSYSYKINLRLLYIKQILLRQTCS